MREKQYKKPLINVYVDQSYSWDEADVQNANYILSVLADYVRKDLIEIKVQYFAVKLHPTPREENGKELWSENSTSAKEVMKDILKSRPDNVIIFTDSDTSNESLDKAVVPGGVWFIWRWGRKSNALLNSLAGKRATKEFDLGEERSRY